MPRSYLFLLLVLLNACGDSATVDSGSPEKELLYVGTYTVRGSEGVYVYQFQRDKRQFELLQTIAGPDSPSFLDFSPDHRYLFTANRQGIAPDSTFGSVCSYAVDSLSGRLALIDKSSSYGVSPCHVSTDETGQWLYLSHYAGGSLTAIAIQPNGELGPSFDSLSHHGHSVHPTRQDVPHVHSIQAIRGTGYFLVADLGKDQLDFYQLNNGKIEQAPIPSIQAEAGTGPRHFVLSADQRFLYISEELTSSVSVYALDLANKSTRFLQRLPTLPADFTDQNTVADIHLSSDGKFLYVSNRGHDSLAIYGVSPDDGQLSLVTYQLTGGKTPRNFMIDPQGAFVLVAHQDSDDVIYFERDANTGLLQQSELSLSIPSPVCLQWLEL